MPALTSVSWSQFRSTAINLAEFQTSPLMCLHCRKTFQPNERFWKTCNNLTRHLDACPYYVASANKKRESVQLSIKSFAERNISLEQFQRRFVMAMTDSMISVNFLAHSELQALFKDINFPLPSRAQFWNLQSSNAAAVKKCVNEFIENADHVALSADGWSSVANVGFNAVVIHTITKNWQLTPFCLGMKMFDKSDNRRQTAGELSIDIKEICPEHILNTSEYFVADTTNLMPATARLLRKKCVGCIVHIANLALRDLILKHQNLSVLCGVASVIVKHVRRSSAAKANVKPSPALVLYCKTRFYSFLDMINSVSLNIDRLTEYSPHSSKPEFSSAVDDFIALQSDADAIINIMTPFKRAFTTLGADLAPTSNKAIFFVLYLKRYLLNLRATNHFAEEMVSILDRRFAHVFTSELYLLANILDPFIHGLTKAHLSPETLALQQQLLKQEYEKLKPPLSSTGQPQLQLRPQDSVEEIFGSDLEVESEIDAFLAIKIRSDYESFDILTWYKKMEESFPVISTLARKVFCVPASSISVERVFSVASQIVTKRRNRLSPDHVDTLLTTKFNLNQLRRLQKSWLDAVQEPLLIPQNQDLAPPVAKRGRAGRPTNASRLTSSSNLRRTTQAPAAESTQSISSAESNLPPDSPGEPLSLSDE